MLSRSNYAHSIDIFLNIISFYVRVPVLSVIKNWILPSSSGMVELRGIVPGMSVSV